MFASHLTFWWFATTGTHKESAKQTRSKRKAEEAVPTYVLVNTQHLAFLPLLSSTTRPPLIFMTKRYPYCSYVLCLLHEYYLLAPAFPTEHCGSRVIFMKGQEQSIELAYLPSLLQRVGLLALNIISAVGTRESVWRLLAVRTWLERLGFLQKGIW